MSNCTDLTQIGSLRRD